ncbi:recombinase family protein [Thalassorhabdus alkalitolerans]|uniref:Recombinase family protein n=1 Tax=Thalassorhabdus alkalitolerans TaxID=2282697 RepID=A0ABW0YMI1_9BACI
MKKTVCYSRSSLGRDKQKHSIEMQEYVCRDFAKKKGWVIHEYYSDHKISGLKTEINERKKLSLVLNEAKHGLIGKVIVYKRDRLSRNVKQYMEILREFKKSNVGVFFAAENEPQLLEGAVGEFVELILGGMTEAEGRNINQKLIDSKVALLRSGNRRWVSGSIPFGYKLAEKTKEIQRKDEYKKDIETVFNIVCENESPTMTGLAAIIKERTTFNNFDAGRLKNMIRNEIYKGELVQTLQDEKYRDLGEDTKEKLFFVEDSLWEEANKCLSHVEEKNRKSRKENVPRYLTGKVFCSVCNRFMEAKADIYKCKQEKLGHNKNCEQLENAVFQAFKSYLKECIINEVSKIGNKAKWIDKTILSKEIKKEIHKMDTQKRRLEEVTNEWLISKGESKYKEIEQVYEMINKHRGKIHELESERDKYLDIMRNPSFIEYYESKVTMQYLKEHFSDWVVYVEINKNQATVKLKHPIKSTKQKVIDL